MIQVHDGPNTPQLVHMEVECAENRMLVRLRAAIRWRRVKMTQLAEATGIPYRTVQNYLSGTSALPASALGRICLAIGVSADWVLYGRLRPDRQALTDAVDVLLQVASLGTKGTADQARNLLLQRYEREFARQLEEAGLVDPLLLPNPVEP